MNTNPTTDRSHRAAFTVTVASRPDGGHYFDRDDFAAHVGGWLKAGLKGRHAIAEVTIADASSPSAARADDRAGLREQIAEALYAHDHPGWRVALRESDVEPVYRERAAAVMPVLPPTADRAAVLREAADALAAKYGVSNRAAAELRRMATETLGTPVKANGRGVCPVCDREYALTGAGRLPRHWAHVPSDRADDGLYCRGVGDEPAARRLADEAQQQPETQAHPAEHTWAAELYDPLAEEWVPGTRYIARDRAVNHLAHARSVGPTWKDGTPTRRRLVRASTTYTVESETEPAVEAQQQKPTTADGATLEHVRRIARRLAAHAVGFQDVLDDSDRGPWGRTVGADIAELIDALADQPAVEAQQQPDTETPDVLATLAPMFDGLHTLIATSSRDWGTYRVDAWLWAVLCGWDCEQNEHDETCTHGAMEEMQQRHGWDDDTVAKARRYRAAVRALTAPAVVSQPGKEA